VHVKIAECFLEEDETVEADAAVTKAGTVVENITEPDQHMALILRYKSTYARVLDANRKFLQAASRYHDLSQSATALIDADDLLQLLGRAATCAILAPSGAQKHRVLGLVYQDDRLHQLDAISSLETHSTLVTKMYCSQVIRPAEVVQFEASLSEHQKALRGDGYSIVERSVMEHNMIAVSRLYKSIYLVELSKLLGNNIKVEKMAAEMIMEGSLHGEIDQVDGILHFSKDDTDAWNRGIMSFCTELNNVTDNIKTVTAE
jgi:COP9 signalosome complex subunit 4